MHILKSQLSRLARLVEHKHREDEQSRLKQDQQCRLLNQLISDGRVLSGLTYIVEHKHVKDEQARHAQLKQELCMETEERRAKRGHELMHCEQKSCRVKKREGEGDAGY